MKTPLYPLKFKPQFLEKIWGGQKIRTILNKDYGALANCGETWELSGVEGHVSVVAEGPLKGRRLDELIKDYREALVGEVVYRDYGSHFPLLIKFIDAAEDLSIQVHPDDHLAAQQHNGRGKTEMWYIMDADPDAQLITGFNRTVDKDTYLSYFRAGKLEDLLNREDVTSGDVFYIPAGRIHTIGKGILMAEIQQTSDITYRIYDFDRTDGEGNKRELHVEEALQALDFDHYENYRTEYDQKLNERFTIVNERYFTTSKLVADKPVSLKAESNEFRILICVEGSGRLQWADGEATLKKGEVYLVPASIDSVNILPEVRIEVLEVRP